MAIKTFGKLTVKNPQRPDREPLILTFVDSMEQWDAAVALRKKGYEIVDDYFGYKLYRNAEKAVDDAEIFLGEIKKEN